MSELRPRRASLYVEVECPGVSERDAANRAALALATLVARHELRADLHLGGPPIEGDEGLITVIYAESLGEAVMDRHIVVRRRPQPGEQEPA